MNVKTEITLNEDHLRYAERMVEEGAYPSVSSVVEAGIAQMMLKDETIVDPLSGMADEIRRRMELPRDQWISMEDDDLFERVIKGLRTYPHIGSTRDEIRAGLRSIPAAEKGVVSFVVEEETRTVLILCISYAGADWMSQVRDRH